MEVVGAGDGAAVAEGGAGASGQFLEKACA